MQGRTHNCGELRLENAGQEVRLVGWYENIRKVSKNLGFLILRDFYGTTQIVVETEEIMDQLSELNYESTIQVDGVVRERSSTLAISFSMTRMRGCGPAITSSAPSTTICASS